MSIKALVLKGEGFNSHKETALAFEEAGANVEIVHFSDFLKMGSLNSFHILCFPGGFSFGDEIRSGKIIAEKIKRYNLDALTEFNLQKKPILGICNGFQILVELNFFESTKKSQVSLTENDHGQFINRWVYLDIENYSSLWLKNIEGKLFMPIRHKEGRMMSGDSQLVKALTYQSNINGSTDQTAAVTNAKGNILGLMPHPEVGIYPQQLPEHQEYASKNLTIFKNAVNYCKRNFQ